MPDEVVGTTADTVSVTDPSATAPSDTAPTTQSTAPANDTVIVTIDGQQQNVPFDEVVKGYQRQADYTRKTQALSAREQELAEADQLWRAFQADPSRTLQVLQEFYGQQGTQSDPNEVDPFEQRLSEQEARLNEIAERDLMFEIEDQIAELREEYGEVDRDELLQYAVDNNIPDLESALLKMRAVQQRQSRVDEHNRQALARKQGLAPIAGGSRNGDAIGRQPGQINNVGDALAEAMAELGLDSLPNF